MAVVMRASGSGGIDCGAVVPIDGEYTGTSWRIRIPTVTSARRGGAGFTTASARWERPEKTPGYRRQCASVFDGSLRRQGGNRLFLLAPDVRAGSHSNSTRLQDLSGLKRVIWRASAAVLIPRSFP